MHFFALLIRKRDREGEPSGTRDIPNYTLMGIEQGNAGRDVNGMQASQGRIDCRMRMKDGARGSMVAGSMLYTFE